MRNGRMQNIGHIGQNDDLFSCENLECFILNAKRPILMIFVDSQLPFVKLIYSIYTYMHKQAGDVNQ